MGIKPQKIFRQWLSLFIVMSLWVTPSLLSAQNICGAAQTKLIAGKNIDAGLVDISHDKEALRVTISTNDWAIKRSQVHVAQTVEGIPQTRFSNRPLVNRFDYKHKYEEPVFTDSYTIMLEELGFSESGADCIDDTVVICVHARVKSTFRRFFRSAWAEGLSFSNRDQAMYVVYELTCCPDVPVIEIDPVSYDFGTPYIGCEVEKAYFIKNIGTADLVINDLQFEAEPMGGFSFDAAENIAGPLPWTLSPGLGVDVFVRFMAIDQFSHSASLTVLSNDPVHPQYTVTASGSGEWYSKNSDNFEQDKLATDILFTLDRSGSMADENALAIATFPTLINTLASLDVDYHVAVAVEDDGCMLGSDAYIDNTFALGEAQSTFETMADIYLTLGTYGANTERGFTLAETALKAVNIGNGGCNEGFYREDAALSLVHISDEPEQSVNPYTYYVSLFQGMKNDPDKAVINAVAGDYPDGCGDVFPGMGYYEATVATGGLFLSICRDDSNWETPTDQWEAIMEQIASGSVKPNNGFYLTQIPVPQTIEVRIDGIATTTGWEYEATTNAVKFEREQIPAFGSTIEVEYHVLPDCEEE